MFEVTGDDISRLDDEDLRAVIGRLCEAELRRHGHSAAHVAWGGNQTAKDGGFDVYISLPAGAEIKGFIPKPETGFQVKKPDMPRNAIINEMKPEGSVRPAILELAKASGAYVIASSTASTTFSALKRRKEAMAEALKGVPDASQLTLDFYDGNRIATWVRDHPGLVPWVRSLVGKSVQGWRSFGSWSGVPRGTDDTYLFDDKVRIKTADGDGCFNVVDGINRIRAALSQPGHVVRLVGLSGVGKTRLCEALFDASIGKDSLDPSLVFYTNIAEGPNPPPVGLTSDLIANRTRAILVIDNCQFELHRHLSDVARAENSTVSIITVEYDIRDDQPEGTDVFALDSSSIALIEKLVLRRDPQISQIDAQTIAQFSGGNARVALALAATVGKDQSISGLSDADLFKRLFQQRHEHDPGLLKIAQVCALVYSFEGVKTKGEEAELPILADLAGHTVQEVYAAVAELKRRDLLQERAEWRAILPHAIANRLAKLALQNIPVDAITDALITKGAARLQRSFSRRLGYLDDSKEARTIVEGWLAPGGMLADVPNLGNNERAMLANVAPVMLDATLMAIEYAFQGADEATLKRNSYLAHLLRSLAYDAARFERSVALLVKFAQVIKTDEKCTDDPASILASLFSIVLSGTHAPVAMRSKVLQGLLKANDVNLRTMGLTILKVMLKTNFFSSSYGFEFGVHSRDYGYHPRNGKDVQDWYDAVMAIAVPMALPESPIAPEIRKCIADEFRGLWTIAGQANALGRLAEQIAANSFWREGWIAVRKTRIFDGAKMAAEPLAKLMALEELLRPKGLVDQVRSLVLGSDDSIYLEYVEDKESRGLSTRAEPMIRRLGEYVAVDDHAFKALAPGLMLGDWRVRLFGEGLASGTDSPTELWRALLREFAAIDGPRSSVIGGFLKGLQMREATLVNKLLDEALEHLSVGPHFPELQASVSIDELGLKRLYRALDLGMAPIGQFYALAYGRASDSIPGPAFRDLLLAIASKPGGNVVAIEVLSMRVFSDASDRRESPPEVAEAGCALLYAYEFHKRDGRANREDHELGKIVLMSLKGETGIPIVRRVVRDMMAAINRCDILALDQHDLMSALLQVQPTIVLDEIFSGDAKAQSKATQVFRDLRRLHKSPLDIVPDETLQKWCAGSPEIRYVLIAATATLFKRPEDGKPHEWTPLALRLLAEAPDARAVFNEIVLRLEPMGWSGSLATKLESRLNLLKRLPIGSMPQLTELFNDAKALLQKRIDFQRVREADENKSYNERFE